MSLSRLAILGALMERPMHGYELKQYFETFGGAFWMINFGSIYPTLNKMRNEGMVIGKKEPSSTVDRIVHTITPQGREEFKNILKRRLGREPTVRDEFTLHLFFLDHLEKKVLIKFLMEKKMGNEALLEDLKKRKDLLKGVMPKFRFETVQRGIMHITTEIAWLNKILKEIEKEV